MNLETLWELLPLKGLGPLRFGMPRDEAVAAAAAFGPVKVVRPPFGGREDMLAVLIPSMGEQAARKLLDDMEADGIDMRSRDAVGIDGVLHLEFVDDTLESLMGLASAVPAHLHIGGHRLLTGDAIPGGVHPVRPDTRQGWTTAGR